MEPAENDKGGYGAMEFTVERTLRRRGKRWTFWGLGVLAGALVWLIAPRDGEVLGPGFVGALAVVAVWRGWRDLRDARRPFRLRIDEFGITLQDAELSWEQIDAAALWHYAAPDSESAAPEPQGRTSPATWSTVTGPTSWTGWTGCPAARRRSCRCYGRTRGSGTPGRHDRPGPRCASADHSPAASDLASPIEIR